MQNWSKNIDFLEDGYFQPESLGELQEMITGQRKIRARGTAHSFNSIAVASSIGLNLSKMPKTIEVEPKLQTVRVAAGLTYGEVAPILHEKGWALSNLASLPHISIAGSISTATHGSGLTNQNLANQVVSIGIVTSEGELKRIDHNEASFNGLVVGLGLGAIVYQYELKIEPTYQIRQVVYPEIPINTLQENFNELMGSAYSVSYFTDWGNNQTGNLWCKYRDEEQIPDNVGGSLRANSKLHPIPSVDPHACTEQNGVKGYWHDRLPHFQLDFTPSVGEEIQSEFFVDIEDASAAIEAVRQLSSEITPLLWITELRTIAADELWLSTAYQRNSLGIHFTWKKTDLIFPVIAKIELALKPFLYRPHWGKVFTADPTYLTSVYPRMADFKSLIGNLDSNEKFQNSFTNSIFRRTEFNREF